MKKTQQPKPERRFLTQEFRVSAQGENPKISGYACVFDSDSEDMGFIEQVDPHAFDNVMATNPDTRALFNHDANLVLGRTKAGTLKLDVDARGLSYVIDPPDTQVARDLIVSMRRGDITQSSFGFICKRDQWTENPDGTITRRILEFDELLDVSPVTYPAFSATSSGVRSLPASMPAEMRSKIAKRGLGFGCQCPCAQCLADACGICSADGCSDPECACVKMRSATKKTEKRDAADDDGNVNGCNCNCPECVADDCMSCSNPDCDDPNCLANQTDPDSDERSKPVTAEQRQRMQMQLALLALKK